MIQLVEYLRTVSARCRSFAETATDPEAAQALREVADEMEMTVGAVEGTERTQPAPADVTHPLSSH